MGSSRAAALADALTEARRALVAACEAVPAERFTIGPGGEEWSAAQVMAHIIEAEDMNMAMVERMLRMDDPQIGRIDHYAARRLGAVAEHGQDSRDEAIRRLREQGERFDRQVRALSDADLARTGQHLTYGPMTVERLLAQLANHMQSHAEQIRALASATA